MEVNSTGDFLSKLDKFNVYQETVRNEEPVKEETRRKKRKLPSWMKPENNSSTEIGQEYDASVGENLPAGWKQDF